MPNLVDYIYELPAVIPAGKVLVHNRVQPETEIGRNGFRAWLSYPDPEKYIVCTCGWASNLGVHWQVRDLE
jgi:hypothetical protein